jgi:hypothetical protein
MISEQIKTIAIKKALQSPCRFKISALAFNKKNELISTASNTKRFLGKGRGLHAEANVIKNCGPSVKTILICRVNINGKMCPIDPCPQCQSLADKYGIKIMSIPI